MVLKAKVGDDTRTICRFEGEEERRVVIAAKGNSLLSNNLYFIPFALGIVLLVLGALEIMARNWGIWIGAVLLFAQMGLLAIWSFKEARPKDIHIAAVTHLIYYYPDLVTSLLSFVEVALKEVYAKSIDSVNGLMEAMLALNSQNKWDEELHVKIETAREQQTAMRVVLDDISNTRSSWEEHYGLTADEFMMLTLFSIVEEVNNERIEKNG